MAKLMDLLSGKEDPNLVKNPEIAPLGWGPRTLEGKCPHCGSPVRAYYDRETCWSCKNTLKWKAPKGYHLNK